MLADLDLLLIAVFCTADDLLPARAKNARRSVTDAEVVTLCVAQAIMGLPSDARFLLVASRRLGHLFPHLPGRPGYWKRRHRLADVIEALIAEFARLSPGFYDDLLVVDSTPVECARSIETVRRSRLADAADYGYCASHSRYFWGFRLHGLFALDGTPRAIALTSPKTDEREVCLRLIDRCQRSGPLTVIGDKGYASQAFHTAMQARQALIVRPRRKDEPGQGPHLAPIPAHREHLLDLQRPAHTRASRRPHPPRPARTHQPTPPRPHRRHRTQPPTRPPHPQLERLHRLTPRNYSSSQSTQVRARRASLCGRSGYPHHEARALWSSRTKERPMSVAPKAIRPFQIDVPQAQLADLRDRVDATRWPSGELVADRSQGVQLAAIQALADYWTSDYDWRACEARLNALPQFTTEIDGVDIHFIHARSPHEDALPLIITHGWPGSVIELLGVVGPLTDPTEHGGSAEDAFHLVLPSLPGYGFSGEPTELGWNPGRIASAWAELMRRLGYTRYVAQGGDVGASVTDAMGRQAPEGLLGIHTNLLAPALGAYPSVETEAERAAADALDNFRATGFGYFLEQATRPQTIGYALTDSPVALAAWMIDHDTDSYEKVAHAFVDKQPSGHLTRDEIVHNVTLYWLTGTGASAAREYWESAQAQAPSAGQAPPDVPLPVGFTTFPGEIFRAPRSWVEKLYPNVTYFNDVDKGGHFAAWEEPDLFAGEIRAAFRSLR